LDEPNGVFVDRYNNLWVADTKNARIQKFAPGSTTGVSIGAHLCNAPSFPTNVLYAMMVLFMLQIILRAGFKRLAKNGNKWVDVAGQNNEMDLTRGVWVDKHGNVYCTDCGHSRVLKYAPHSSTGVVVAGGNGYGNALNQLARPASVVVDDEDNMYITDQDNQRVVKWAPGATSGVVVAGNGTGTFPGGEVNNPIYSSVTKLSGLSGGQQSTLIYISDKKSNSVELWVEGDTTGTTAAGGNGRGDQPDQLNKPYANFISGNYLYVADRDNARIQRFDLTVVLQIPNLQQSNLAIIQ